MIASPQLYTKLGFNTINITCHGFEQIQSLCTSTCSVFVEHGSEHQVVVCWSIDSWGQRSVWVDCLKTIDSKQTEIPTV